MSAEEPLRPSLVAVIVAAPSAKPSATPLGETLATAPSLLCHVTVRPLRGFPSASIGVAVNWALSPTGTLVDAGLTVTDATATWS